MERTCNKYDFTQIAASIPELKNANFELYIDTINSEEIIDTLTQFAKKTRIILYQISTGRYSYDLYENLKELDNVTCFIYKGKMNYRIYCKEYKNGKKKIVLVSAVHKKSQGINKSLRNQLTAISKYKYIFI